MHTCDCLTVYVLSTLSRRLYNNSVLSIFMRGVISLPDTTPYDNTVKYCKPLMMVHPYYAVVNVILDITFNVFIVFSILIFFY